ncbi:aspartyl-phosphate phosphatase Spo0E family protein [Halobacillus sp. A5]|uniref:aspartyl-phosphate phosphatase Spo0E family protein n=1 Tax=Halobacillus sp. A5 TaxID=2880263 RepID=UPI0020A6CB51|nr:aspartyl-phosphate phosphatase Spo0E family protein [Halobacillus sp. A5]MCP3027671.1 aspartyl-phosphate phosphatase Spo0E family protein [Halobacillus sp. A5]
MKENETIEQQIEELREKMYIAYLTKKDYKEILRISRELDRLLNILHNNSN